MLEAELTKKISRDPVVEYIVPKKIFFAAEVNEDELSGVPADNLLLDFWDFE